MSWFAVGGAATSIIGGVLSDKKEKKQRKEDKAFSAEQARLENQYAKEQSKFDADLQYHYNQKARAGRQRGLDEFRKFSTLKDFAPGYTDTSQRIQVPTAPSPTGDSAATNSAPPANFAMSTPVLPVKETP